MKSILLSVALSANLGFFGLGCGSDDEGSTPPPDEGDEEQEMGVGSLQGLTPAQKLVTALGGNAAFGDLQGLRVSSTGKRYLPHEGFEPNDDPVLANEFDRTVSFGLAEGLVRIDVEREIQFLFPAVQSYSAIVRGNLGVSSQDFFGTPLGNLSSDRVAAIQAQEMLLNPHLLLTRLGTAALEEDGDFQLEGKTYHRLLASGTAQPIYLFVEAETGQLARLDTREKDFYRGDVVVSVAYTGWQTSEDGVGYPSSVELTRDGLVLMTQDISSLERNPNFDADTFDFPAESDPMFDAELFSRGAQSTQWYYLLDSIGLPFSGIDVAVDASELAPGVRHLKGGSHNSFLVEQAAGLVLVDAPLHQDRAAALLDYIETQFPNKPVTHVVASHFHEDHVAGIREILGATQAALVVHESSAAYWRETLEVRSTIAPDSLARSPREVEILTVDDDGTRTLPDAQHPVELYDMNSNHANDLLLTRDVASNTVFVVDVYSPGNATQFEAEALDATLLDNDIPVDDVQIAGGHGVVVHQYADLQEFLD